MRSLSFYTSNKKTLKDIDVAIILLFIYLFISKFFSIKSVKSSYTLNFLTDIDLSVSTDFEDLFVVASDVFEVMEHDRLLAMDGISDLFMARGFLSFSSNTSSTIR